MDSDDKAPFVRRDLRDVPKPTAQPMTVLFLAANPMQVGLLQLGEECRVIEHNLRLARFRDQIRFQSRWTARPDDLLQALNDDAPSVLHFSGHGVGDQGLCFQSDDGSAQRMTADNLTACMQAAGDNVLVVVMSACYSATQAQALVAHAPCVIGTPAQLSDQAAIHFSAAFYGALAAGSSVAHAHQHGVAALALASLPDQVRGVNTSQDSSLDARAPRLLTRPGIDAETLYLVQPTSIPKELSTASAPNDGHCTLVLNARLSDINQEVLARITEALRLSISDPSITLVSVEEGSVRLTFSLSRRGAQTIVKLRADGQLTQLGGFEVSAVIDPQEPCTMRADNEFRDNPNSTNIHEQPKGVALCCGFNDYDTKPLQRAVNDAAMLYAKLTESGMYNADPDLIGKGNLFTERTSASRILDAFTRAALSSADLVWFSFSGHSFVSDNGELRLLLPGWRQDGNDDMKRTYSIGADELENALRSRPANKKIVIVLDSCQSGAFGSGLVTRDVASSIEQRIANAGAVVISSCAQDQSATDGHTESRDLNGEFTGAVIETLDHHTQTGMPLRILQLFSSAKDKIRNGQRPTLYTYGLTDDFLVFSTAHQHRRNTNSSQDPDGTTTDTDR